MRTESSKGIVQLRLLWISTKTRSSVSFPKGHVNKLGLIVKESPEKRKLRFFVDMRRSNANARAEVPERPILPRPRDVVADWEEVFSEAASWSFTSEAGVSCENVTCDFSDAYCHVLVHPEELKNCLVAAPPSPSGSAQNVALVCRMGFGSKGAPLTWCRIAAALGRAAQAMLMGARWSGHAAGRVNTQKDDPHLNLLGTPNAARQAASSRVTLLDRSRIQSRLGQRDEVQRGQMDRFGVRTRFSKSYGHCPNPSQNCRCVQARCARTVGRTDVAFEETPPARGKGGWIMNLLPKARWTIQRFWESHRRGRTATQLLEKQANARKHTRGGARNYLTARRQVEVSSRWIVAFWGDQGLSFSRVFGETRPPAEFELVFDASPWGLGGILTTASSSEALQFFHEPLTPDDCTRFNVDLGDAKGQQHWEALSVLVGIKLWGPLMAKSQAIVKVKSDSVTALQCTAKLASSSPLLNGIGAEIALVLELHNIEEVVTQHVPGKLNEVADKLSRLAQPGVSQQLPPQVQGAKRRVTPKRDDAFFRSWAAAVGPAKTAQVKSDRTRLAKQVVKTV